MASGGSGEQGARYRREAVGLVILIVAGAVAFAMTRAFASANRRMRLDAAARWYAVARASIDAGKPGDAVAPLRRAAAIDRDNPEYRLTLASALAASGSDAAARQLLLTLRQFAPEDPDVNLQLARLERRRQDLTAAVQYYQNALYGLWRPDRIDERRNIRRELIDYLLASDQRSRALSEILILSANAQDDAASQSEIGRLLLKVGSAARAHDHFRRALRDAPHDPETLTGAGLAAFEVGDYASAARYFRSVPNLAGPPAERRDIAEAVLANDPLARRLAADERYRRLERGLEAVGRRLDGCAQAPASGREELETFKKRATRRAVAADPDLIDQGVELIGRLESAASNGCGAASVVDVAWQRIAGMHGSGDR